VTSYRALELILPDENCKELEHEIPTNGLFACLDYNDIKHCIEDKVFDTDPQIISINQQSPIEIVIVGSIAILTAAAILSGGKQTIKLGPVKFEFNLSSLGESICKLRLGLSNNPILQTGNEFIGAKIKLNKEEYAFLNKPANMNGGFQRFIRELQIRVKKRSKEIELSNRDIDKILKYKSNPKKGGFQSRFNKIFGRHLS
jgi:hypothetical protein